MQRTKKVLKIIKTILLTTLVVIGGMLLVGAISLVINAIFASIIYLILVKAIGVGAGYWQVFWWIYLVIFIITAVKNIFKS